MKKTLIMNSYVEISNKDLIKDCIIDVLEMINKEFKDGVYYSLEIEECKDENNNLFAYWFHVIFNGETEIELADLTGIFFHQLLLILSSMTRNVEKLLSILDDLTKTSNTHQQILS